MRSIRTILLIAASISFITILGGGTYEHLAVVPRWKLAPPASLSMFQGEYGLNAGKFWMTIHPLTILLLLAALITNWKTGRRKYILVTFSVYALILIITSIYFVPELMAIIHTSYQNTTDPLLVSRAGTWEKLSLVRLVLCVGLAACILFSLTKENENASPAS